MIASCIRFITETRQPFLVNKERGMFKRQLMHDS